MILLKLIVVLLQYAYSSSVDIYYIDDTVGLGRRFDGIGGISGGGATSKLLVSYPEEQRSPILDYLFKPNFGASLQILKVEIGGDGQSSDGTEASHMHHSWDEDYTRGYEWWLMVEAKRRNPNIKIYGLPWSYPGWLNPDGERNPYTYPYLTYTYISKWIQGAATHYNITVDYIGIWNERFWDKTYIKKLRQHLDQVGLGGVQIVAPDAAHAQDWDISWDILHDQELAAAVDIVGCHYPGTITTSDAIKTEKPLWASEDYSTFNDIVGGGCWARLLNQNFVNGNITGTISWNLIAAYYDGLSWNRDGLMTAQHPWCGHYVVESPIWMSAHTTQFTDIGWHYYRHGYGSGHFVYGGSYVTLASPDGNHITVVIETMSHDHSNCIRPYLPPYHVYQQNVTLKLIGKFSFESVYMTFTDPRKVMFTSAFGVGEHHFSQAHLKELHMWKSTLRFDQKPSTLFQKQGLIPVVNGTISLWLDVDVVITLTTLATGYHGEHPPAPAEKDFPLPFHEDFEKYADKSEAPLFAQQTGLFEIASSGDGAHGKVMRQMVLDTPIYWCTADQLGMAVNVIGSTTWKDIYIETDARISPVNGSDGVFVGAQIEKSGCDVERTPGVFFFVYPANRTFVVTGSVLKSPVMAKGSTGQLDTYGWNNVRLLIKDSFAMGSVNSRPLFNVTMTTPESHGFAGVGTASWGIADFDNVNIKDPSTCGDVHTWMTS